MSEMLPEYWALGKDDNDPKKANAKRPKPITDFHMWLQCFATYAGILGQHHPAFIPELMAYIITISTAVQDFDGQAWVRYDTAYRHWAAASGNRRWSLVNPSIYAMCFTGRASVRARCDLCLRPGHLSKHCTLEENVDTDLPGRMKAVESVVLSLAKGNEIPKDAQEICRLYNNNSCRYRRCKYRHVCVVCGGNTRLHDALKVYLNNRPFRSL